MLMFMIFKICQTWQKKSASGGSDLDKMLIEKLLHAHLICSPDRHKPIAIPVYSINQDYVASCINTYLSLSHSNVLYHYISLPLNLQCTKSGPKLKSRIGSEIKSRNHASIHHLAFGIQSGLDEEERATYEKHPISEKEKGTSNLLEERRDTYANG